MLSSFVLSSSSLSLQGEPGSVVRKELALLPPSSASTSTGSLQQETPRPDWEGASWLLQGSQAFEQPVREPEVSPREGGARAAGELLSAFPAAS